MAKFSSYEEIYSALYVDFDNIFTRLYELGPDLAHAFATNPQRWMRWIEGHALRMLYGDGVRRRILKRCCYLNPHRYHEYRPYFIRAAFQVVDCPPLTNQGKTSADIHLVMDCMDALAHSTRFDEFIILSGDADFTPLLIRLQEHARRTLVLSVGYTSPAYAAASSWRIREDWFISQALEDTPEQRQEDGREGRAGDYAEGRSENRCRTKSAASNIAPDKKAKAIDCIKNLVAESNAPVPLPSISQVLQSEMETGNDWLGFGRVRDFVASLDLSPLEFSPSGQGFVYDPSRHTCPEEGCAHSDFKLKHPELYALALKVHHITELPLLKPEHYESIHKIIVDEILAHGFLLSESSKHIYEECIDEGLPVGRAQINAILTGITRGGCTLKDNPGLNVEKTRQGFLKYAQELCQVSQLMLTDSEQEKLIQWLTSGNGKTNGKKAEKNAK